MGNRPSRMETRKPPRRWYGSDRDARLVYEPSADDFLSPSLIEALLMKEIMDSAEFGSWLLRFLPDGIGKLAEPPVVADRTDPKQSHLDGLCLTRAWCLAGIGLAEPAEKLIAAALPHVAGGDYAGEHWLPPFPVLGPAGPAVPAGR